MIEPFDGMTGDVAVRGGACLGTGFGSSTIGINGSSELLDCSFAVEGVAVGIVVVSGSGEG